MRKRYSAVLADRGVVRIGGAEARGFLQNIVTTDMDRVAEDRAGFGALLSPQGKILADFLVFADGEGFLIDLPKVALADFVKRMTLYRLRAKVEIADLSSERKVAVFWGGDAPAGAVPDPRLAELGHRAILAKDAPIENETPGEAWHAHRIALGVPEGGHDFSFGEAFPHDVDMDDLAGVDFRKGCYVGQEIVSRMQHRGTARRRAVIVTGEAELADAGTAVEGGGKVLGALGSHAGTTGIALLRLDRTRAALDAGASITAGGVPLSITLPAFAHFGWPAGSEDEGAA